MTNISSSVGRGGVNNPEDVKTVQALLNQKLQPSPNLEEDGVIGAHTLDAIMTFQSLVLHFVRPDGRVDPNGKTFNALNGIDVDHSLSPSVANAAQLPPINPSPEGISEGDFQKAAAILKCEVASIKAVNEVEAGKSGFFPSGRPKILFEAHHFSRLTGHKFDRSHPNISSPKWNRALYKGGEQEYSRLVEALALDHRAALQSASWGRFQIMGFNYKVSGFDSVDAFVAAMYASEGKQLEAFVNFIASNPARLAEPLREKHWAAFASHYNGPAYAQNHYDAKLLAAYKKYA